MISLRKDAKARIFAPPTPHCLATFDNPGPIEVDLGCGRGHYAWLRAIKHPGVNVLALDSRKKWIDKLCKRIQEEGITNLGAIRCDVTQDLPVLFAEQSVAAFTVHHPDPWWKKKHRKRRLIRPAMVEQLARLLAPGGFVFLQTDVPDLADEIKACFDAHPRFQHAPAKTIQKERMGNIRSHREMKCIEKGIPVERLAFVRVAERHPGS